MAESEEARSIRIDAHRIRYRKARKEVMGKIVRNCVVGNDMKTVIDRYCTELNIEDKEKFTIIALDELSKLHTGALLGIGVTEEMFEKWKQENQQINGD